jgi:hypothetical protein
MHGAKLHIQMLVPIIDFSRTLIACKKNSMKFIDDIRITKLQNGISHNDWNKRPFYHTLDTLWHQSENVMKHVSDFVDEIDEIMGSAKFRTKFHNGFKDDDSKKCWIDLSLQMKF